MIVDLGMLHHSHKHTQYASAQYTLFALVTSVKKTASEILEPRCILTTIPAVLTPHHHQPGLRWNKPQTLPLKLPRTLLWHSRSFTLWLAGTPCELILLLCNNLLSISYSRLTTDHVFLSFTELNHILIPPCSLIPCYSITPFPPNFLTSRSFPFCSAQCLLMTLRSGKRPCKHTQCSKRNIRHWTRNQTPLLCCPSLLLRAHNLKMHE